MQTRRGRDSAPPPVALNRVCQGPRPANGEAEGVRLETSRSAPRHPIAAPKLSISMAHSPDVETQVRTRNLAGLLGLLARRSPAVLKGSEAIPHNAYYRRFRLRATASVTESGVVKAGLCAKRKYP